MSARSYGRSEFQVAGRPVGPGHPCFVVAEAGSNHNRDLPTALRLIEVAAEAGADAVKFQTYTAEGLYSRHTPTMTYLKDQGMVGERDSVWGLINRVALPWEWHQELAEHARDLGITFLSTPFEEAAVDVLEGIGVPAYKIASYEVTHLPLLERVARTGKPVFLSTGMAALGDIERALDTLGEAGCREVLLMHCAVNYPARFENLNLRAISTLISAFQVPVGWSDHTLGWTADVVAVALGACAVEKHFTLDRSHPGPDHPFALNPPELASMARAAQPRCRRPDRQGERDHPLFDRREAPRLRHPGVRARVGDRPARSARHRGRRDPHLGRSRSLKGVDRRQLEARKAYLDQGDPAIPLARTRRRNSAISSLDTDQRNATAQ